MPATVTPTTDSYPANQIGLDYVDLLVLSDLMKSPEGKCVCHIASSIGVAERSLYSFLAALLADELVRIRVSEDAKRSFFDFVEQTQNRHRENPDSKEARIEFWRQFFSQTGTSTGADDIAPRYYVAITNLGKKRLRSEVKQAFVSS